MTKIKKIIAAMLATMALATSAVGVTSNAFYEPSPDNTAALQYDAGYAKLINNSTTSRFGGSSVAVYDISLNYITQNSNEGLLGYNGSVTARVSGYNSVGHIFRCAGAIHAGNLVQTPTAWSTRRGIIVTKNGVEIIE